MADQMQLHIHFHEQDEASVILESTAIGDLEEFGEILLFNYFALRQMHNLGSAAVAPALAHALVALGEGTHQREETTLGAAPRLVAYRGTAGKKRFVAALDFGPEKARFVLHPKGFGMLAWRVNYYAPQSVLLLFRYLTTRRPDSDVYRRRLSQAGWLCGQYLLEGKVTTLSQPTLALGIAQIVSTKEFQERKLREHQEYRQAYKAEFQAQRQRTADSQRERGQRGVSLTYEDWKGKAGSRAPISERNIDLWGCGFWLPLVLTILCMALFVQANPGLPLLEYAVSLGCGGPILFVVGVIVYQFVRRFIIR